MRSAALVLALSSTFALATALGGCAAAPGVAVARSPRSESDDLLVPSGNGSLLQEEITLTLTTDSLTLKVTPLEEWVLRLTAPDTWTRLSGLASSHRAEVTRQTSAANPALFLVSFFSRAPGTAFHPQDVEIENRGRRQRPLAIRPLTSGWGTERLRQEEAQVAVYAFADEMDLEQTLTVQYGDAVGVGWEDILRRLEAERARARARSGLGR